MLFQLPQGEGWTHGLTPPGLHSCMEFVVGLAGPQGEKKKETAIRSSTFWLSIDFPGHFSGVSWAWWFLNCCWVFVGFPSFGHCKSHLLRPCPPLHCSLFLFPHSSPIATLFAHPPKLSYIAIFDEPLRTWCLCIHAYSFCILTI